MYPDLYHIGTLKTGTTTIQKTLKQDSRLNVILYSRYFNTDKYNKEDYHHFQKDKVNIETDENICRKINNFVGLELSLKRIKEVSPNAKIIYTIREQKSALVSMYKHHIRKTNDSFSFEEFLKSQAGQSYLETLTYDKVYHTINKYFDKKNIFFYLFEDFKTDTNLFYTKLYDDLFKIKYVSFSNQKKENTGISESEFRLKRSFNKFNFFKYNSLMFKVMQRIILNVIQILPSKDKEKEIFWNDTNYLHSIENMLKESNTKLVENCDINLNQYGYLI